MIGNFPVIYHSKDQKYLVYSSQESNTISFVIVIIIIWAGLNVPLWQDLLDWSPTASAIGCCSRGQGWQCHQGPRARCPWGRLCVSQLHGPPCGVAAAMAGHSWVEPPDTGTHQSPVHSMYEVSERFARPGHSSGERGQLFHTHDGTHICNGQNTVRLEHTDLPTSGLLCAWSMWQACPSTTQPPAVVTTPWPTWSPQYLKHSPQITTQLQWTRPQGHNWIIPCILRSRTQKRAKFG